MSIGFWLNNINNIFGHFANISRLTFFGDDGCWHWQPMALFACLLSIVLRQLVLGDRCRDSIWRHAKRRHLADDVTWL